MEIHLIRHTKVNVATNICYGQTDVELRSNYIEDFKGVKLDSDYDLIVSSPLKRCTQMADFFNLTYLEDSRLQELNFGEWENSPWEKIPKHEIDPWYKDYITTRPPHGESLLDFKNRIEEFKEDFIARCQREKILIITHSGVIRMFLQLILQFPLENLFNIIPDYGKKCVLKREGDLWRIISINT